MLFARAGAVDIVDAEQERAAGAVRGIVRQNRAICVAEVEFAGRAGGEEGKHGAGAESRYCVLKDAILLYFEPKPHLPCESDTDCNNAVTRSKQWRALPSTP